MKVAKMLAMAAVLAMVAGVALAADEGGKKRPERAPGLRGKIVRVEGTSVVIKKWAREEAQRTEVTVATDDKTAVTIDGKEATVANLAKDMYVLITPETGTAQKILARTKLVRGPGKGDRKKPAPAPAPQE
jgi:hypothetical protein